MPDPTTVPTASTTSSRKPGGVAVLGKAARLLDLLAEHGEMTPSQLAELTHEPRSTVYRLLSTLEKLELVEAGNSSGAYRLGLKLFQLGSAVVEGFDERAAAQPVMARLHEATGETVFLCVRRGLEAVCIERIDGVRVALLDLRLGGALPLHLGAAPRALLAFEPRSAWDAYLSNAHTTEQRTSLSPHTHQDIIRELEAIQERGYAISDQDVTLGIASIGAPVFGHTGAVCASISIGGLRDRVLHPEHRSAELITRAAEDISHALGHRPGAEFRRDRAGAGDAVC